MVRTVSTNIVTGKCYRWPNFNQKCPYKKEKYNLPIREGNLTVEVSHHCDFYHLLLEDAKKICEVSKVEVTLGNLDRDNIRYIGDRPNNSKISV